MKRILAVTVVTFVLLIGCKKENVDAREKYLGNYYGIYTFENGSIVNGQRDILIDPNSKSRILIDTGVMYADLELDSGKINIPYQVENRGASSNNTIYGTGQIVGSELKMSVFYDYVDGTSERVTFSGIKN